MKESKTYPSIAPKRGKNVTIVDFGNALGQAISPLILVKDDR